MQSRLAPDWSKRNELHSTTKRIFGLKKRLQFIQKINRKQESMKTNTESDEPFEPICWVRLVVRTSGFHPGNTSSILVLNTMQE